MIAGGGRGEEEGRTALALLRFFLVPKTCSRFSRRVENEWELAQDGTVESSSGNQALKRERGQGWFHFLSVQLKVTTSRRNINHHIWLMPIVMKVMTTTPSTPLKTPSVNAARYVYVLPPPFIVPDATCAVRVGRHMFVGISERTNEAGARFLAKVFGPSLPVIPIPVVRKEASRSALR